MDVVINYWAVLGAAIANMVVGSLWYGPLFGKKWQQLMGFTSDSIKSMKMSSMQAMFGGLITALLMSYVLAHFVSLLGIFDMKGGTEFAFWTWLGLVVTTQAASVLWEGKSWKLFCLNATQSLVSIIVMTWILARWQ
jgi:hypothetical protein